MALLFQLLMNHKAWVTYFRTRIRLFLDGLRERGEQVRRGTGGIRGLWQDAAKDGGKGQD